MSINLRPPVAERDGRGLDILPCSRTLSYPRLLCSSGPSLGKPSLISSTEVRAWATCYHSLSSLDCPHLCRPIPNVSQMGGSKDGSHLGIQGSQLLSPTLPWFTARLWVVTFPWVKWATLCHCQGWEEKHSLLGTRARRMAMTFFSQAPLPLGQHLAGQSTCD